MVESAADGGHYECLMGKYPLSVNPHFAVRIWLPEPAQTAADDCIRWVVGLQPAQQDPHPSFAFVAPDRRDMPWNDESGNAIVLRTHIVPETPPLTIHIDWDNSEGVARFSANGARFSANGATLRTYAPNAQPTRDWFPYAYFTHSITVTIDP